MTSYRANRRACIHYGVPNTDAWNGLVSPDQNLSQFCNTLDLAQSRTLEASRNYLEHGGHELAGLGRTSQAANRPTKRLRSNSDEASEWRLSQVQALLEMVHPNLVEEVYQFLSNAIALSSVNSSGAMNSSCSMKLQSDHICTMMDIQDHGPTIPNEIFPQSDLVGSEDFGLYQDCMFHAINVPPSIEPTIDFSQIPPNCDATTRLYMPIQKASHRAEPPPRSYKSNPSAYGGTPAVAEANRLLHPALLGTNQNRDRDSVLSISSYNSIDTDIGMSTKHSSMTSLGSQSSRSSRKFYMQRTSVSSISEKKTHSRSSSLGHASNPPLEIHCTYPDCTSTFTREHDRVRHEASIHNTEAGYTCLLHTCAGICPEDCKNRQHNSPYQNARPDKMKEHLEKIHGWSLKQGDIPKSFLKPYDREQRGWKCGICGISLGSWHDNEHEIEAHSESCTEEGLQTSFNRMNIEGPGRQGLWKPGNNAAAGSDKALPEPPLEADDDDDDWIAGFLDEPS